MMQMERDARLSTAAVGQCTALGQALHTSGCLDVDAYAEDDRCLYLDAPGLGPIISRIGESQISVMPISRHLVAHCNIAPSADGAGVLARAITQIHTHRRTGHGSWRDRKGGALDALESEVEGGADGAAP